MKVTITIPIPILILCANGSFQNGNCVHKKCLCVPDFKAILDFAYYFDSLVFLMSLHLKCSTKQPPTVCACEMNF